MSDTPPWGEKSRLARAAGISSSHFGGILIGRKYGTEEQRRAIAAALGYSGRAYEDFLDIGRRILKLPVEDKKSEGLPARNAQNFSVGFIFHDLIFQEPGAPSVNEVARRTGVDVPALDDIISNKKFPTFQQLEAFYNKLKINPTIFFIDPRDNPQLAYTVDDQLLNILVAAGQLQYGEQPNETHIARVFGVKAKEVYAFLQSWRIAAMDDVDERRLPHS